MRGISLKIKVVIPVAVMILTAMLVALFIVNQVVRRQVLAGVSKDLEKSRRVFKELQERELELLLDRSWVAAEAPHLKAAVDTGDSTTVQSVASEFFNSGRTDILIITDHENQILAQNGFGIIRIHKFHMDSLLIQNKLPEGEIGLLDLGAQIYRTVSVPILALDEITGVYLLGKVTLGKAINQAYVEGLKDLVDCEISFVHKDKIVASTIGEFKTGSSYKKYYHNPHLVANLKNENETFQVKIKKEEFLAELADSPGNYLLLQSVDRAFKLIMQPIEKTMLFVGGFAILTSLLISRFISHEILTPIKQLVKATDAVTAGDYTHSIEVRTHDEIGHLADKFDEMRHSLQQKMTQLKQQNVELEEALKKLEATQEELLRSEKLAATGKITAQLSHELNNPIHNIQNCLEAVKKKISKGHPGREFIDLAYDEVLRIGKLIRQMLDLYRPQVNKKQTVDINQIVREVLKSSESVFQENKVEISCNLDDQIFDISTSPDQLKQVFLNFVLNSIDAMPDGGTLQVSTHCDDNNLSIAFEDTGCGIEGQHLKKIFDAFFTTKAKASGVGLGLTVSYGIIRSLGGNIIVESQLGKGSKFLVQLPVNAKQRIT